MRCLPLLGECYRVLMVTTEPAPLLQPGAQSDGAALRTAMALRRLGNPVAVVAPRYRGMPYQATVADFPVVMGGRKATALVRRTELADPGSVPDQPPSELLPVYLIDNYHYFDRDLPTGHPDDAERFEFFCRAVLELPGLPGVLGWHPEVLHLYDWPTGLLAYWLRDPLQRPTGWHDVVSVFTFQYTPPASGADFLRLGMGHADLLTTVSRQLAGRGELPGQATAPDGDGTGLPLVGILHGIDTTRFDPAHDPCLYRRFGPHDATRRGDNKAALRHELELGAGPEALLAAVMPLTVPRGVALLVRAIPGLMARSLQLVVMGSGETQWMDALHEAATRFPGRLRLIPGYNPVVARRLFAGADVILGLAQEEPVGTEHLTGMRYGAVPVVRAVASLADAVVDFHAASGAGNGFTFRGGEPEDLLHAVDRALDVYRQPPAWQRLVGNVLQCDFSWERTAVEYMGLYAQARNARRLKMLA